MESAHRVHRRRGRGRRVRRRLEDDELLLAVRALHDARSARRRGGGGAAGRDDQASTATIASIAQTESTTTQMRCMISHLLRPTTARGARALAAAPPLPGAAAGAGRCTSPSDRRAAGEDGRCEDGRQCERVIASCSCLRSTTSPANGGRAPGQASVKVQAGRRPDDGVDAAARRLAQLDLAFVGGDEPLARSRARGPSRPRRTGAPEAVERALALLRGEAGAVVARRAARPTATLAEPRRDRRRRPATPRARWR